MHMHRYHCMVLHTIPTTVWYGVCCTMVRYGMTIWNDIPWHDTWCGMIQICYGMTLHGMVCVIWHDMVIWCGIV